jgi:hypothetical protein
LRSRVCVWRMRSRGRLPAVAGVFSLTMAYTLPLMVQITGGLLVRKKNNPA